MEHYPALRVPSDYIGISYPDVGYLNIKNALEAYRSLAVKNGARLMYSAELLNYDSQI